MHVFGFELVELSGKSKNIYMVRSKFKPDDFSPEFREEFNRSIRYSILISFSNDNADAPCLQRKGDS